MNDMEWMDESNKISGSLVWDNLNRTKGQKGWENHRVTAERQNEIQSNLEWNEWTNQARLDIKRDTIYKERVLGV